MAMILLLSGIGDAIANTYYVRSDGGSPTQCTGSVDAAYPGFGSNQACAWHHPFDALPPNLDSSNPPPARIAGGDTLYIQAGNYEMGLNAPGASAYAACNPNFSWDCHMQAVPSGPSPTTPTRILGHGWDQGCHAAPQLWGSEHSAQVLDLDRSSNVVVACLEITDHSSCIEHHMQDNSPFACNRSTPPFGSWASFGIHAEDSGNVSIMDVDIHGMANRGILAGRLHDWTLTRVRIVANGWAGWDGDLAEANGSSDSGRMLFQNVEVGYNGCGELYPSQAIFGCWGQQEGGYGDGLGAAQTGGNWVFNDSYFHHNTQDGLDLLYADGTGSVTVERTRAEGSAGNQIKLAGTSLVENSTIVGNCSYFEGIDNMSGNNLGGGSTTGDICRAMGNALVVSLQPQRAATIRFNSITGEGDCLILAINGDATSSVAVQNNALLGKPNWPRSAIQQSCLVYWDNGPSTWPISYAGNLVYQVKDSACPPRSLCNVDPLLANAGLDLFDALPLPGSPLINAAAIDVGVVSVDGRNLPRPTLGGYDVGAVQYQGIVDLTIFRNGFD